MRATADSTIVLGAGVTGLAAGIATGGTVLERASVPGGICSSYYLPPRSDAQGSYRFEYGGGHWVFGGEPATLDWMERRSPMRVYRRRSSVYFPDRDLYVPYPLQNHLAWLGARLAETVLDELRAPRGEEQPRTLADWLLRSFGPTLCGLFFDPFHEAYTAGLHTRIAPQDPYKSPVDMERVAEGARGDSRPVGYNVSFRYPAEGLDHLTGTMARGCDLRLGSEVVEIRTGERSVRLAGGAVIGYRRLISTLPLDRTLALAGTRLPSRADPCTAVLVLNIGAMAGPRCPQDHWLYVPRSRAGFHRVGFYSNVDPSFVPAPTRAGARASIYVEKAFLPEHRPAQAEIDRYAEAVVAELRDWGYIAEVEVLDPTWIDVAYTWAWPGSAWRPLAIAELQRMGIEPVGRYARWQFQGIAESIRDGLAVNG